MQEIFYFNTEKEITNCLFITKFNIESEEFNVFCHNCPKSGKHKQFHLFLDTPFTFQRQRYNPMLH